MAQQQLLLPGEMVKKSNALARARWSAESVLEPRLVALLASKINATDKDFQTYEIHVSELSNKSLGGNDYKELAAAVDKTMSRVITIYDDNGWTKYNVFSRCRFRRSDGVLELGFHPDLIPHYLQLKKNFAQYNLFEYLTLPSIYSQRIFEYLKSWDDCPETTIQLNDLHELLDTPASFRKDFRNFRLRVLEKSHKDIHGKTALAFEWEPIKQGRTVVAIRFVFSVGKKTVVMKEKQQINIDEQCKMNNKLVIDALACYKTGKCAYKAKSKVCIYCREKIQK